MIGTLVTFFFVGLIALVAISLVLAVVGTLFSIAWVLAGFLLFKVAPVVLVGYLIVRFLAPGNRRRLKRSERRWLES